MSIRSAATMLRSPRLVMPIVITTSNFYPPTVDLGTENAPIIALQGALVATSLIAGALAFSHPDVRRLFLRPPLVFGFILAAWMTLSALQADQPFDGAVRGVWFGAVALVVVWTVVVEQWETALLVMAASIAALLCLSVLAYPVANVEFQGNEFFDERLFPWPRLRGLTANHTIIGLSGALISFVAFSVGKAWSPTISRIIFVAGVLGVLASHSRAAIGALAVGVAVEIFWAKRNLLIPAFAAGLAIFALWMLMGADGAIFDRSDEQEAVVAETDILTGRGEVWSEALDYAEPRLITGHGVGSFADHTGRQFEDELRQWDPVHAHNVVLELLVDQGLIGVFNLLAMVGALAILRSHLPPASIGILVIVGAHSMVEGLFYGSPITGWFFVVAVLAGTAISESSSTGVRSNEPVDAEDNHGQNDHSNRSEAGLSTSDRRS